MREWGLSKSEKKQKDFWYQPKKKPSPGWMAQTPWAGTGDSWADFAVIGVQLCATIMQSFPVWHFLTKIAPSSG